MMKRKIVIVILSLGLVTLTTAAQSSEFSADKGRRIENFLQRIARAKKSVFLRKVTFNQDDLNAYLNIFYARKYAPEAKYIKLQLGKENYVSGTVKVELSEKKYKDIPDFFRDFEVDFSGTIESEKSRMRFVLETLKINGTGFSPEILDETFGLVQGNVDVKTSIFDWFNLLPGVKKVSVDEEKITFYY